jgi:para-aminobenzoate synthetase/4-amino-4-deoxychorismate lyase
MEIIRELETSPRGVYTGAIGYLTPTGDALFNVPIRTVVLDGEKGEMGIGSGIVADSLAKKEWQECLLKSHFLSKPRPDFQLIETMLWSQDQGYWLLDEHLERAQDSARYFGYRFDKAEITTKLINYQGTQTEVTARIRLLIDREGNITISHTPCPFPQNTGLPSSPQARNNSLPRTRLAAEHTDSSDIFLYHKTTQRKVYNRLWQKAHGEGYVDIIFTNERGEISEGAITNIFVEKEGVFYTPPVASGLLPGIYRGYLLTTFPERVREKTLCAEDLSAPGVILHLGNSVRGLVQVELIHQP